jgi:hypothetical protein
MLGGINPELRLIHLDAVNLNRRSKENVQVGELPGRE